MNSKIIIGIDPGSRCTGYGVVILQSGLFQPLDFGCIRPPALALASERYAIIFESLELLLEKYEPHDMAIETQFVQKNAQSALKLGIAMGCALIAAKRKRLKVYGYSPREVKCAVAGTGKASKDQIQSTVQRHLSLKSKPTPQDAADALAIAICHATFPTSVFTPSKKEL